MHVYVSKDPVQKDIYNMTTRATRYFLITKIWEKSTQFLCQQQQYVTAVPEQSLTYNLSSLALGPIKSYWTLISKKIVFLLSRIWIGKKIKHSTITTLNSKTLFTQKNQHGNFLFLVYFDLFSALIFELLECDLIRQSVISLT